MRDSTSPADSGGKCLKTISAMSAIYKISLRTLRFYEDKGLLQPTRIGTQRLYSAEDESRLQIVLKGKQLGFTLQEIEKIILSSIDRNPETKQLAPEEATMVVLTPALMREKLDRLTQTLDATNAAIAELTQRMPEAVL